MTAPLAGEPAPLIDLLVVQLMEQSARDAAFTTNALLDGYRRDAAIANATLNAVRAEIAALLDGPYAPSAARLYAALYPSVDLTSYDGEAAR